jgi:hypothetical protein
VLARSTWQPACPVQAGQLRYLTMSFWGFDGRPHTGEMLVNASVADAVIRVFGTLFAAEFPIEKMRVTGPAELDARPPATATTPVPSSAVRCAETNWSAHAYGLAVDLDPFCNPYTKGVWYSPSSLRPISTGPGGVPAWCSQATGPCARSPRSDGAGASPGTARPTECISPQAAGEGTTPTADRLAQAEIESRRRMTTCLTTTW